MPSLSQAIRTRLAFAVLILMDGSIAYSAMTGSGIWHFLGSSTHRPAHALEAGTAIGTVRAVVIEGVADTEITIGSDAGLEVDGDEGSVPLIQNDGGTLRLIARHRDGAPPRLRISLPALESLELRGGKARIDGLEGPRFVLRVTGTAEVTASGVVDAASIEADGAGKLRLEDLETRDLVLTMNGAGEARVQASGTLAVHLNGPSHVTYSGSPAHVTRVINGPGVVEAEG